MAKDAPIPAPVYVRYVGPGDTYLVRCTIGPYRVIVEANRGVPYAVPVETADALPSAEFERVDIADAIELIAAADQHAAQQEAEWRTHQAQAQRRREAELAMRPVHAERIERMREAVLTARSSGMPESMHVAHAVAAAVAYDEELHALAEAVAAEG